MFGKIILCSVQLWHLGKLPVVKFKGMGRKVIPKCSRVDNLFVALRPGQKDIKGWACGLPQSHGYLKHLELYKSLGLPGF